MIKYTPQFLKKLEDVFGDNGYTLRYERGNFKSGFCVLEERKIVVVNKYSSLESRIITILEILKSLSADKEFTGENFDQISKYLVPSSKAEEV
ncbi:MAG TPA: hypothetical protein VFW78_05215 [Bacteroidia bacterium]|nr:hypothetical protein [Bacteroidia bacterium]